MVRGKRFAVAVVVLVLACGVAVWVDHRPDPSPRPPTVATVPAPQAPPIGNNSTCDTVAVAEGSGSAWSEHLDIMIVLTNRSRRTCTMTGYPQVVAFTDDGRSAPAELVPGPSEGPAPTVRLAPGQAASARLEGLEVNSTGEPDCPRYTRLQVAAPGATQPAGIARLTFVAGLCSLEIQPVGQP